jgi:shikimate dehydrogenase
MDGCPALSGETRLFAIIGDPIAQVKSPASMTRALTALGLDCVLVPIHVTSDDVDRFLSGVGLAKNLDGIIATVPHKFAAYAHCTTATERANVLQAVNIMRRNPDGGWHGEMTDGLGFVNGIRAAGCRPEGQRALLIGAGGAGSAIALALMEAGVADLAVHDADAGRRDALVARLKGRRGAAARVGSADPTGCTLVVNATPVGMRPDDPYPVQADKLTAAMFVGDVITVPAVTPLIEAARRLGCATQTGGGMYTAQLDLMRDFLIGK